MQLGWIDFSRQDKADAINIINSMKEKGVLDLPLQNRRRKMHEMRRVPENLQVRHSRVAEAEQRGLHKMRRLQGWLSARGGNRKNRKRKRKMNKLFSLTLTDTELSYENFSEDFFIGIFATKQEAEAAARYYLENVKGFCDFPCTKKIKEKQIADCSAEACPSVVWIANGWNENEFYDEVDIIESDCFISEENGRAELEKLQKAFPRQEWTFVQWKIGELFWQDGFVRTA